MADIAGLFATFTVLAAMTGIVPLAYAATAVSEPSASDTAMPPETGQPDFEAVDIDRLTTDSDFTRFMRPDCPPDLQLRALRKLWTLLPARPLEEPII